jgi:hypothetical protein
MSYTPTYLAWVAMIQRCKSRHHAKCYSERGIKVCARWRKFENFFADMGERPKDLTLDRRDNDRGYELGNCRWATRSQQMQNRRKPSAVKRGKRQAFTVKERRKRIRDEFLKQLMEGKPNERRSSKL